MGSKERFYADISTVCSQVTGSCHLVVVKFPNGKTTKFVVDCGLFQEKENDEDNNKFTFKPESVEFCLITHNHVDHTGRIPLLVKKGFYGKTYMTEDTRTLIPLNLEDSYKVLKDIAKRNHSAPLYSESNVVNAINNIDTCKIGETKYVNSNIKVTFFSNGHLIGAAMILVQISFSGYEDINLLFVGDYNNKNIFLEIEELPAWVKNLKLTVIMESTYGNMNSGDIHKCFRENLLSCISSNGTIVAPVFSLGRAQEILYVLKELQDMRELKTDVPIFFDGKLGVRYTHLMMKGHLHIKENMRDFLPTNCTFVDKTTRDDVLKSKERKIILTTSGMGSYGPAQLYIPEYIQRLGAMIHFTGYTAPHTLGGKLQNVELGKTVEVNGILLSKRAKVEYTNEFSAHAKADELIDFLKQFNDLKLVLVTHGESNVREIFAKRLVEEVKSKNVGILDRQYVFRVSPYGLVKTLNTKYM